MASNKYVSFEVSKLLKKLEYNEECFHKYTVEDSGEVRFWQCFQPVSNEDDSWQEFYAAPAIEDVVCWIDETFDVSSFDFYLEAEELTDSIIQEVLKKLL